jgi:hypothetical protein
MNTTNFSYTSTYTNRTLDSLLAFMAGMQNSKSLEDTRNLTIEDKLVKLSKQNGFFMVQPTEDYLLFPFLS